MGISIPENRAGETHEQQAATTSHANHFVQFYEDEDFLCDAAGGFIAGGLATGNVAVLVATPVHDAGIRRSLRSAGLDPEALPAGSLRSIDASTLVEAVSIGGVVDPARCRQVLSKLLEEALAGQPEGTRVRVFGEAVDMLIAAGQPAGAMELEAGWNDVATHYPLTLLCAYSMQGFRRDADSGVFAELCGCHGHVLAPETVVKAEGEDARLRELNRLHQRAHALEAEVEQRRLLERALRGMLADLYSSQEELHRAKEEAERASRAKSDFLAVMSHELRTPLNAIFGYRDLLVHGVGGEVTAQQRSFLERIGASATQLLDLIDQVLSFSRLEADADTLALEAVNVCAVVEDAVHTVAPAAAAKGLSVDVIIGEPVTITTDEGKFRQVLLNLLSNAVKFTSIGGVRVTCRSVSDGVAIDVEDSGIGIETADIARIFEPFVQADAAATRRYGGTGLGLSVSRSLAGLLGGEISVVSEPGAGARFTLRLPLDAAAA